MRKDGPLRFPQPIGQTLQIHARGFGFALFGNSRQRLVQLGLSHAGIRCGDAGADRSLNGEEAGLPNDGLVWRPAGLRHRDQHRISAAIDVSEGWLHAPEDAVGVLGHGSSRNGLAA